MIVDTVTEEEAFQRLRDHLLRQDIELHRGTLDGMRGDDLGRFYTTRTGSGDVVDRHVDLARWVRQHGVLKPNEGLVPTPDPA